MISVKGSNRELATAAPTQCLGPVNTSTHTDTGTRTMSPLQLQEAAILEHFMQVTIIYIVKLRVRVHYLLVNS